MPETRTAAPATPSALRRARVRYARQLVAYGVRWGLYGSAFSTAAFLLYAPLGAS